MRYCIKCGNKLDEIVTKDDVFHLKFKCNNCNEEYSEEYNEIEFLLKENIILKERLITIEKLLGI